MSTPDNKTRKLILGRESLVALAMSQLERVVGGAWIDITKAGKNSCCVIASCKPKMEE